MSRESLASFVAIETAQSLTQDLVTKMATQEIRCVHVELSTNTLAQLVLHAEEIPARHSTRLEVDQAVDVVVRAEDVMHDGREKRETLDVVEAA